VAHAFGPLVIASDGATILWRHRMVRKLQVSIVTAGGRGIRGNK
jgi:hypothetical protein